MTDHRARAIAWSKHFVEEAFKHPGIFDETSYVEALTALCREVERETWMEAAKQAAKQLLVEDDLIENFVAWCEQQTARGKEEE